MSSSSDIKKSIRCSVFSENTGKRCKIKTSYNLDNYYFCHVHRYRENTICNICLEPICKQLYRSTCNHTFHNYCIYPWLMRNNTCPCCRYVIPSTLLINIGIYRKCIRKFNKGCSTYFWLTTDKFRNFNDLYMILLRLRSTFLPEHLLSRSMFYISVNNVGNKANPVSFKYFPKNILKSLYGVHKSEKITILENMIKRIAA